MLLPKHPPERSPAHLAYIRSLRICLACGARGVRIEAAHVRMGGDGAAGMKPSDSRAVPLDALCHNRQHNGRGERHFWIEVGADPAQVAADLWAVSGDVEAGVRIVERALRARGEAP